MFEIDFMTIYTSLMNEIDFRFQMSNTETTLLEKEKEKFLNENEIDFTEMKEVEK